MPHDRADVFLHKAAQDALALRKLIHDDDIEDDLLGFHAQQAVEKTLKALLAARGIDYPKTHNIRVLIEVAAADGIHLPAELADIDRLTHFGTTFRYDTVFSADSSARATWLEWVEMLRRFVEPLIRS